MKKIIFIILTMNIIINFTIYSTITNGSQITSIDDSELIDEFTWSVIRGDFSVNSKFGIIHVPKPSEGIVMIPANMMSKYVCNVAVDIYSQDKMDSLKALEKYDVKNMFHIDSAFFRNKNEWNSPIIENYHKASADEMLLLGKICFRGNLVGDCYSQASFNTAVLRLCGFAPEEVFTILITGHALNIVKIDEKWYAFDSTKAKSVKFGYLDSLIFESYNPANPKRIFGLENDKYFINFGNANDHFFEPYSNIDPDLLIEIAEYIVPMFNYSNFSHWEWGLDKIDEFIENATAFPEMETIGVPYTVEDAQGNSIEEKAQFLQTLIKAFIINQTGNEISNQYDRSLYVSGFITVDYPQAYANAAKYAAWTSYFGDKFDRTSEILDCISTAIWIKLYVITHQIMPSDCISFSDLPILIHAGSSVDQAVMSYGMIRNMKKNNNYWQPEDLNILITEDNKGYLAVNTSNGWRYVNFVNSKFIEEEYPKNVHISFNEIECVIS